MASMTAHDREQAAALRYLAGKLATEGWDRLRGMRLALLAHEIVETSRTNGWLEAFGRAETLEEILSCFVQEAPDPHRLQAVLQTARALADLLEAGRFPEMLESGALPVAPESWRFILVGLPEAQHTALLSALQALGFTVVPVNQIMAIARLLERGQTVLVAPVAWIAQHAEFLAPHFVRAPVGCLSTSVMVGLVGLTPAGQADDFALQLEARRAGARLLLDQPLDTGALLQELAGVAWMPSQPYRVLVVDDDAALAAYNAQMLRSQGCTVEVCTDPLAVWSLLASFAPEVCVLDMEMPHCRGSELAALLRREKRFTRLPIVYLSGFDSIEQQLDARCAGGEDFLVKPVDVRLLQTAVLTRARQFRRVEGVYRQRRQAWRELSSLKEVLDSHAIVSTTTLDGTIIDVNDKFCDISGYGRDELIGRNHRLIKSGKHPQRFFAELWQEISLGKIWQGEIQNRAKDGAPYWVQGTVSQILDGDGLPDRYISIRTDITEQKRALAERERQARLLELLRQAMQYFIAGQGLPSTAKLLFDGLLQLMGSEYGFIAEVSQDPLPTPSLRLLAMSPLLWESAAQITPAPVGTPVDPYRLATLFTFLLYQRERAGEAVLLLNDLAESPGSEQPAPPRQLANLLVMPVLYGETLVGLVGLANRPGGYQVEDAAFLHPLLTSFAGMLEAMRLRHLRTEALEELQQARRAGELETESRMAGLSQWGRELYAPLNAILGHAQILLFQQGMDASTQEQIEEIYKGGQQCATLLNDFMQRLETEVRQQRQQHPPALPVVPEPEVVRASVPPARRTPRIRQRILVAEDNPANQAVLRMQLEILGFEADIAPDGAAALEHWKAGGHALILADRNMPVMSGLELTRAIRAVEQSEGGHIPIIAITAAHQPEVAEICRAAGMDDLLPKPIDLDDLQRRLEVWLPETGGETVAELPELVMATPHAEEEASAVLSLAYLTRIVGPISQGRMRELVDLFTVTAGADLPRCRLWLEEGNLHGLAQTMHLLKSSARMVGALRFAVLTEQLEQAILAGELADVPQQLEALLQALADVEARMVQLVSSHEAGSLSGSGSSNGEGATVPLVLPDYVPECVLVVDDDPLALRQARLILESLSVREVLTVSSGEAALHELRRSLRPVDLLITDLNMPGMDGIKFLRLLAEDGFQGSLIVSSGVDERLLQTTAELIQAKGLNLVGVVQKPLGRTALLHLLNLPRYTVAPRPQPRQRITPEDIVLALRHDEFEVCFQPKVDATTLRPLGVEVLARWVHQGELVPPEQFVLMAEENGLIALLSEMLMTKALMGGARLHKAGYPLSVAVNVSSGWLSDINLPEFILSLVEVLEFPIDKLMLEITETGVMADVEIALDVLTRLRLKGFRFSIDDFGIGYSSLEQLQRIPFSELKLDRSFVQGASDKPAIRAILASTIDMAKKLRLHTVAEGVERQADLDLVRGLGCHLVQGWLIAKAMPIDTLIDWLGAQLEARPLPGVSHALRGSVS